MNKIYCFSGSGKSRKIANFFAEKLNIPIIEISDMLSADEFSAETAVIVFPVYCQNLPDPVRDFLPKLNAENTVFIASYGRKSFGNVIYDAANLVSANTIAGACVPMGHSFLNEPDNFNFELLEPILERIACPEIAYIPKEHKVFYADLIPAKRTQLAVIMERSDSCDHCGKCIEKCPMHAMKDSCPSKNCIRCLRCVNECPKKALSFKIIPILRLYLETKRKDKLRIYL